jgi:adenine-specific DNA methylase
MLQNGLGELLEREVEINGVSRFVDLFAGSGAVAIHVAKKFPIHVLAFDLQKYSAVIAGAVIEREHQFDWEAVWLKWERNALARFAKIRLPKDRTLTRAVVSGYREWSGDQDKLSITKAYGGYYYSPLQAGLIDALLDTLPERGPARKVALAALIKAASRCAAAPGHTAQPFQPTRSAKPFLRDAWSRDVVQITKRIFTALAGEFAQQRGEAKVLDANLAAKELGERDIAFIDPPYSGVHYSRFYHVLETIARCKSVEVSGEGRYPAPEFRPRSKYSVMTEAPAALSDLFSTIAKRGAKAIITFPHDKCSNGLSGYKVRSIAEKYFRVERASVSSRLSTLGGRGDYQKGEAGRAARRHTRELMLVLKPK